MSAGSHFVQIKVYKNEEGMETICFTGDQIYTLTVVDYRVFVLQKNTQQMGMFDFPHLFECK